MWKKKHKKSLMWRYLPKLTSASSTYGMLRPILVFPKKFSRKAAIRPIVRKIRYNICPEKSLILFNKKVYEPCGWSISKNLLLWNCLAKWTEIWWEAPMEGSVLSILKAEWKVRDTGSAHWASNFMHYLFFCETTSPWSRYVYEEVIIKTFFS